MKPLTIISGVPASLTVGAGRLIQHLVVEALTWGPSVQFVYAGNKGEAAAAYRARQLVRFLVQACLHYHRKLKTKLFLKILARRPHVVLIHFQEIGVRWCSDFLLRRTQPTWIYILDASFFCIRSYNHLPGDSDACLLCLGGSYENALKNHCKSFPVNNSETADFIRFLHPLVSSGRVRLLAQNERNAELIRCHYGPKAIVKVIGLWTSDMNDFVESLHSQKLKEPIFDVVYHGDAKEAKGLHWAISLAFACPNLKFLFPCLQPVNLKTPNNCTFRPMRWETGLRDAIHSSYLTLNPSLWSAPIEGALVKSILHAQRVAVVAVESSFSSELSSDLVCHLPKRVNEAAEKLEKRLAASPTSRALIRSWFLESRKAARLVHRIAKAEEEMVPEGTNLTLRISKTNK
jgi:hypothetical protein